MKKKINYIDIATKVLSDVGGNKNIESFTNCQTRLRITVKDLSKVKKEKLKAGEAALGLNITGSQVQVIFGTGKVVKVAEAFSKVSELETGKLVTETLEEVSKRNKDLNKEKQSTFQKFISKFSGIFAPLILGFIGAGILAGVGGIIKSAGFDSMAGHWKTVAAQSWFSAFNVLLTIWKGTFLIIVGWRTAETFGGSGVIGAIIAGLYVSASSGAVTAMFVHDPKITGVNFLGVHITSVHNWFITGFRPTVEPTGSFKLSYPSGSIFGVMISAGLVGLTEKGFRKIVPNSLDTVLTPTLSLIALLMLNILVVFSISGYIFTGVSFLFKNLYGNPFGAALLACIFLITVVFGVHQGFVPIYAALIANTGINGLFPVLAMAGASQVGMALALWFRAEKGGVLKRQIQGAIIPGILGIGEPLIYGVSLPRVKPFITAMLGGAVGGFFMGAMNLWGGDAVGLNTMFGPSGILASPLMTSASGSIARGVLVYIGGLVISYSAGFGITYFFGHKNIDLA